MTSSINIYVWASCLNIHHSSRTEDGEIGFLEIDEAFFVMATGGIKIKNLCCEL